MLKQKRTLFSTTVAIRAVIGLVFMFLLHGFNLTKILFIVGVNYCLTRVVPSKIRPVSVWAWALIVLFGTEWIDFPFIPKSLFLGFYTRWNIVFKVTVLRMISYSMDHHCFLETKMSSSQEKGQEHDALDSSDFEWLEYLAFLFYPPLYLAGPIMTFQAFISQLKNPNVQLKATVVYGLRMLSCFLFLDILLHYCHVQAIKESRMFVNFTPLDFGMVGFFNLKIIWLKLLIIWRFFRLIALFDGINPPENMMRCMTNNYSGMAFWRSWHRSFYLWIVKYLYVPLGGSKHMIYNIWPVFMFVAVWHDLSLHLLAWSWLICLFFIPEFVAKWACTKWNLQEHKYYRQMCGAAAAGSICMMMIANLVGFAIGLDGMKTLVKSVLTTKGGFIFSISALLTMYSAAQVMFEVRAEELRNGIKNNF